MLTGKFDKALSLGALVFGLLALAGGALALYWAGTDVLYDHNVPKALASAAVLIPGGLLLGFVAKRLWRPEARSFYAEALCVTLIGNALIVAYVMAVSLLRYSGEFPVAYAVFAFVLAGAVFSMAAAGRVVVKQGAPPPVFA